ncbi:MAG: phosphonate metabolism protein/1,5-bisphosphokinase (PRPP-forming) PhnN [Pseudomonadota bacterium]
MTKGRLIAVVGPSGVGKDSVMEGLRTARPGLHLVRRVITRAPGLGGEVYDPVTPDAFADMVGNGAFALHWQAHGLSYGIPVMVKYQLNKGTDCLANLSRSALQEASRVFDHLVVLNITARPDTLAQRLTARGRETPDDIARRLAQATRPLPPGLNVIDLPNDGPLPETIARAMALLRPAEASVQPSPLGSVT